MELAACKYRGRVIGWLSEGDDGFLKYEKATFFSVIGRLEPVPFQPPSFVQFKEGHPSVSGQYSDVVVLRGNYSDTQLQTIRDAWNANG